MNDVRNYQILKISGNKNFKRIINEIKKHGYVHAGSKAKNQKIKALDDDLLKRLKKEIDVILIEADGSHGLPLKYPRNHEPVVDKDSSEIILITSLKGLGKPAQRGCFAGCAPQEESADYGGN